MLQIDQLTVRYGQVAAIREINLTVERGRTVAILGPNGAGKTTLLSAVAGLLKPATGRVVWDGTEITGWTADRVVREGVVLTPEGRRIHGDLTVRENLVLGGKFRRDRSGSARDLAEMMDRFPILAQRSGQRAGDLSGGEAQQLAIARSLMARPQILLLDEPTLGLAPKVVSFVFEIVAELAASGLTLVVVDQNAERAMELADHTYVLRSGRIVAHGTAAEIGGAAGLAAAYLGQSESGAAV